MNGAKNRKKRLKEKTDRAKKRIDIIYDVHKKNKNNDHKESGYVDRYIFHSPSKSR